MSNTWPTTIGSVLACAALASTAATPFAAPALKAQVGHPPNRSPYRDIRVSHALTLSAGYVNGSGGKLRAGPSVGPVASLRYSIHLGGPFEAVMGAAGAELERTVYANGVPSDTVRQGVLLADVGLGFVVTGHKTWHGLAPYVGVTLGAAFGEGVPEDTTGFNFKRRFQFGPQAGIRWYPTSSLSVQLEFKDTLWRLVYPASFFRNPPGQPLLKPSVDSDRQWTHNPALSFGIGLKIRS